MIDAYEKKGIPEKVEDLFIQMQNEGIKPDVTTW